MYGMNFDTRTIILLSLFLDYFVIKLGRPWPTCDLARLARFAPAIRGHGRHGRPRQMMRSICTTQKTRC